MTQQLGIENINGNHQMDSICYSQHQGPESL